VNLRKRLVVDLRAVAVWACALAGLALIDLGVTIYLLVIAV
jgi:hypothetical protein